MLHFRFKPFALVIGWGFISTIRLGMSIVSLEVYWCLHHHWEVFIASSGFIWVSDSFLQVELVVTVATDVFTSSPRIVTNLQATDVGTLRAILQDLRALIKAVCVVVIWA